jgi:hypothetical protein
MVMPHDKWMTTNKFYTTIDNQGEMIKIFKYKDAILENPELLQVITKVESLLKDRGLITENMEQKLNSIASDNAENAVLTSKVSKSSVSESSFDKLMKTAKADVLLKIDWTVTKTGPQNTISYTLAAYDAYTGETIGSGEGNSKPSFEASIPVLLSEAVNNKIDVLLARIQAHADDIAENGRRVKIVIKKRDSWSGDLEQEYGGKELKEILEDWMMSNSVKGSFETETSSENIIVFIPRIPVFDPNGNGMSAQNFIRPLNKLLKAPPYSIENKLMEYGLGKAQLMLGSK